jgi:hypothetical protein
MIQQAQAAGVKFNPLPEDLRTVSNPVVHDQRNTSSLYGRRDDRPVINPESGEQTGVIPADERRVILPDGGRVQQPQFAGSDPQWGPMMEGIIQRPANWQTRTDNCAGQVDMVEYRKWLLKNYGITMVAAPNEGQTTPCQR